MKDRGQRRRARITVVIQDADQGGEFYVETTSNPAVWDTEVLDAGGDYSPGMRSAQVAEHTDVEEGVESTAWVDPMGGGGSLASCAATSTRICAGVGTTMDSLAIFAATCAMAAALNTWESGAVPVLGAGPSPAPARKFGARRGPEIVGAMRKPPKILRGGLELGATQLLDGHVLREPVGEQRQRDADQQGRDHRTPEVGPSVRRGPAGRQSRTG